MTADECGKAFPDDPVISAEARLLRRIPPFHIVTDPKVPSGVRPSSAAFEDDEDGSPMSTYRLGVIEAEGGTPARVLLNHGGFRLVSLRAAQLRAVSQSIHPNPLQEESSHALICGPKPKRIRRKIARDAEWLAQPSR